VFIQGGPRRRAGRKEKKAKEGREPATEQRWGPSEKRAGFAGRVANEYEAGIAPADLCDTCPPAPKE